MLLTFTVALLATATAAHGPGLSRGFVHFYNLEYDEAIREFKKEVAAHPDDPATHNHLAQAVLYREMLRAGALESEMVTRTNPFLRRRNLKTSAEAARTFDEQIGASMKLCEARLAADPKDIEALYDLGVAYGLRANYSFLVRKAWMDSLRDATQARKCHNKVTELDPENIDAKLVQGLHDYILGSLPWHYKVLSFLAGMRGNREDGINTLQLVAEKGNQNRYDAKILLAALYRREKEPRLAIPLLDELVFRFPRNYLFRIELALMHEDLGENDRAIEVLDQVAKLKRTNAAGLKSLPIEKVHYYKGTVYFWADQFDRALDEFQRVTPKGGDLDLNTEVTAWMRTGQIYDVKGDRTRAIEAYRRAVEIAPDSDPGKESKRYIDSPYRGKNST